MDKEKGQMIPREKRQDIVNDLLQAKQKGLTWERGCRVLGLSPRTVERWRKPVSEKREKKRPLPCNALTPWEREVVRTLIQQAVHADCSVRELSILALEEHGIYVSPVTFWRYQEELDCNGPRRGRRLRKGQGNKPDTSWVDGPNQLWAWDITHLPTGRAYEFWYLYALQDAFSRKVVAWLVTDSLRSEEVKHLWDQGLLNEGLIMRPSSEWPASLSDRGPQMRSHSTRRFFQLMGVVQLYARPRTPNDNPHIEALFSVTKTEPEFPGIFPTLKDAVSYFTSFFHWYNEGHLHTSLQMLTPEQVHSGKGEEILEQRRSLRDRTLAHRRAYHLQGQETRPDSLAESGRKLPLRFQRGIPGMEPDSPQKIRQSLLN